jgi:hypothetical protein
MNLNNIKTGVKLIKEIVANSKSVNAPWHRKNQLEANKKAPITRQNKEKK